MQQQQPHQQLAQQHLAHLQQEASGQAVALVHQPQQVALAEAALEAHLQQGSVDRQVDSVAALQVSAAAWEATKWEVQAQRT